ncbi:MAG TPA: M56 family metallopeptidase [Steroidobacteraceae bacterium]|jgi:beta-lactamase regulating signal transducer with metallopeptidase domain|nr:M56 family metallopeptidase [Steroidobacteraceae bacterium]
MISYLVLCLVGMTLAASVVILIVGLVRKPLRRAMGARAAYWVWLLVPGSTLAVLLPAPSQPGTMVVSAVSHPISHVVTSAALVFSGAEASVGYPIVLLLGWLAGVLAMAAMAVGRQRSFVRSLGRLYSRADGTYRSEVGVEPMLVGLWRPRIVLPADFEARYTPEEGSLILAHERAHLQRGDALVNAIAAGWLCMFWFNPLMYVAVGWLRFDQDLASDALVLAAANTSRRQYATALLKTQLICESPWRLPIGCRWQSSHPLKERIGMLSRPLPGFLRRCLGISMAMVLTALGGCAVWGAQPLGKRGQSGTPIAIHMRWLLNGVDLLAADGHSTTRDFVVADGVDFDRSFSSPGKVERIRCVVSLPTTRDASRSWNVPATWQKLTPARGSTDGLLLVECIWRENGRIVMTPMIVFPDGGPAAVELRDGVSDRRLEFKASTSRTRILHPAQLKLLPLPAGTLRVDRPSQARVCLVTTRCQALEKLPPRLCPVGSLSCQLTAGRFVSLSLHDRPSRPDR